MGGKIKPTTQNFCYFFFWPPKAFLHNTCKTQDEMLFIGHASSALDNYSETGYAI